LAGLGLSLVSTAAFADHPGSHGPSEALFLLQIIVLLVGARLLGEFMQRIGQPAVMGQLIAGILLGPSVLGAVWPWFHHLLFPTDPGRQAMIGAVAELGILLLLLLTGMETDLAVVRQSRRSTFCVAIAGMAVPFLCGFALGEMLPQALLHDPDVLVLDEPTDGLDPNQKHEVRRLISTMPEKAIVISTHILEEVDAVCTRAIVIANGRVVADGTPGLLAARSRHHNAVRLELAVNGHDPVAALLRLPGVETVEPIEDIDGSGILIFPREGQSIIAEVTDLIRTAGWPVAALRVERGRLDDVFRTITLQST